MAKTLTGRDPRTGEGIAIAIEDGVISSIQPSADTGDSYLSAGLVDLQVNGHGGVDINSGDVTPERVLALNAEMLKLGVTTYLPTLVTASEASFVRALSAIAEARKGSDLVRHMIPFVHVEGPTISPTDGPRGAHPLAHVRAPSLAEFERWQAASGGLVGMVTLAPEYPEAPDYIRAVTARGVHVALGHSAAAPEDIHRAAAAGAVLSTHLGNGAAATLPRHPNFIWSQLADDRLTATFIADGFHLPADAFKAMLRAKGLDRAVLVSDSVALAGMKPGRYEQFVGGAVDLSADGKVSMAGTPYLAGAGLPLCANVAIAIEMAGLSLADGLRLATVNPGKFAGGRGRLEVGQPADLIRFAWQPGDRKLQIRQVLVTGVEQG